MLVIIQNDIDENSQIANVAFVSGVISIGFYALVENGIVYRRFMIGEGINPTIYAAHLVWAIILTFSLFNKKKKFNILLLLLTFQIFLLILTQGRNAILSLLFSLIITMLLRFFRETTNRKNIIKHFKYIIVIAFILIITFKYVDVPELDNIIMMFNFSDFNLSQITSGRSNLISEYIRNFNQNIVSGNGVGSGPIYNSLNAHNSFIMILFEMGFIGFALWLSVIISILLTGFKNLKNKQYNVLLFSLVLFFMSFGNDTIYKKYWWIGLIIMFINIKNTAEVNYNE